MCTYGIGLPFDHPIWQNLPPCRCDGVSSKVRFEDFGVRVAPDPEIVRLPAMPPARGRRGSPKRYEAPVR